MLGRPDVPVFPLVAVGRLGLLHPFLGAADSRPDVASLWDADLDAVRRVCLDMADAIPEGRRGLMDEAVGKLAVREPRPADAVPAHPGSALAVFPVLPA